MDDLVAAAAGARARAHAPYSKFAVGAAVETPGGVFAGCNVENASLGLTICGERAAVFAAVAAGEREVKRVAVVTSSSPPAPPCGACLQVLLEFCRDCEVVLANDRGERRVLRLRDLAPHGFSAKDLG